MHYDHNKIESKWQTRWATENRYSSKSDSGKPKFYALDMFPYPSGAGLHVGHPLGYIASDIVSRFKRLKGYNVLHPMGYDAFGLPAEQYAIQTGQHPDKTTKENIAKYRQQLDRLGFSFDWSREVKTCDPNYYKWTQWIFIQLFKSWYNPASKKAESIQTLIEHFSESGSNVLYTKLGFESGHFEFDFSSQQWNTFSEKDQQEILMEFRLAFRSESFVNWCPALGTVLANDEVKDGLSERGGHPVEKKIMKQWSLRISAYAQRLLDGLEEIEWSESIKEAQRNWIGKSTGASVFFDLEGRSSESIEVFTTRPDTLFGVSFLTIAPEHPLAAALLTQDRKSEGENYINSSINRSERERQAEVKNISGVFTGSYAIHPFSQNKIPIWIGDYVLGSYGTGAVMGVPAHDSRDYAFAKHFHLDIKQVIVPPAEHNFDESSYDEKSGTCIHSSFLDNLSVTDAIAKMCDELEKKSKGKRKINFRLRDAVFGRQRYWGEPIPVYYKDEIPYVLDESELPLILPSIDSYLPTESGEPPLARANDWKYKNEYDLEQTTMPGWAGSSWYYLRYMDPNNDKHFASKEEINYWQQIDLYIGGAEHATGHLLYFRFWTKFLSDINQLPFEEPALRLVNQGMIQGTSSFVYRINGSNTYVSKGLIKQYDTSAFHVDVNMVENNVLDLEKFKAWRDDLSDAEFILEDGQYFCGSETEKMSKSKWNVVSPDEMCDKYGADCFRMYEMFLGPLEDHKPWNTNGIVGVYNFLKKLYRLFFDKNGDWIISSELPSKQELKVLHKTIRKIEEDIERLSLNTSISTFMICVNELSDLNCNKQQILTPLLILLSPFAPHICEELYERMGNTNSILNEQWPLFEEVYVKEDDYDYPVSVNGKTRFKLTLPLALDKSAVEKEVLSAAELEKWLNGTSPKKIIVVPGRIINIVI
ncbi:MAG TPA: leucine--tRNA ligase [Bacteroidia bacterium]|nr:leucine--tRNA ligase [Bacteroidia bacterium]HNT80781.1 leucine--tRNA ligase [Bacteroidia bacterium]